MNMVFWKRRTARSRAAKSRIQWNIYPRLTKAVMWLRRRMQRLPRMAHSPMNWFQCVKWARPGWSRRNRFSIWTLLHRKLCRLPDRCGVIDYVDARRIVIRVNDEEAEAGDTGVDIYNLVKYTRSNQNTNINQR